MAPIERLIELCPDRKLLDPHFGGYKLSLSPVPVTKKGIEGVDVLQPSEEQFSFLHQKEFAFHNHLCGDIWNNNTAYYINKERKVMRVGVNENSDQVETPQEVWDIPAIKPRLCGDYNVSLRFSSADIAVLCDGAGSIHVLQTSSRDIASPWKLLHSHKLRDENRGFKLEDCRCINEAPNRTVYCILRHIQPSEKPTDTSDKNTARFEAVLEVVSLMEDRGSWRLRENKKICHASSVEYSVLQPACKSIFVAGDIPIPFAHQSRTDDEKLPEYYWQQSLKDIKIWFDITKGKQKSDVVVETKENLVKVCLKGNTLIEGKLFQRIDPQLTSWSLSDERLEVTVQKGEEGRMWQTLLEGSDIGGKEVVNKAVVDEIHSKLSHLCSDKQEEGTTSMFNSSQLEECDAFDEESRVLIRYDAQTMEPSHKVMLGGQQWLLNVEGGPDKAGGFCLRYDVDGCVWAPHGEPMVFEHVGTFLAFGYIEASKTNKKFVIAPPDLSYIAIIDVTNHAMIYRRGVAIVGKLRNRKTGEHIQDLATQQLVNLQTTSQLLGAIARPKYIIVLTADNVFAIAIPQE